MIGFRPGFNDSYLERERLLRLLPQDLGYVVWLEAAYGYGKSVLTTQWVQSLESEGLRVFWLSLDGNDPKALLVELMSLPDYAPWNIVLEQLWQQPTVLVLEDLTGEEGLDPLLKDIQGLILLASRKHLSFTALPKLLTEGRLIHLTAEHLAFTLEEAKELFSDTQIATSMWEQAKGWSLPLHFAALTGEPPQQETLLAGFKESVSPGAWQEALFLSAIAYLPKEAVKKETLELSKAGFVQELEDSFRLHEMMAGALLEAFYEEVRTIVLNEAQRLSILQRGDVYAKIKSDYQLEGMLSDTSLNLQRLSAEHVIRWANNLSIPLSTKARMTFGDALLENNQVEAGFSHMKVALDSNELEPNDYVRTLGTYIWHMAQVDTDKATALVAKGEALLPSVSNQIAAGFLSNVAMIGHNTGDYLQALNYMERGLELATPKTEQYTSLKVNRSIILWELTGNLEEKMFVQQDQEGLIAKFHPERVAVGWRDLVRDYINLGQEDLARTYIDKAQEVHQPGPYARLETKAMQAFLDENIEPFPALMIEAKAWEMDYHSIEIILYFWFKTLRYQNDLTAFEELMQKYPQEGIDGCERAVCQALKGDTKQALDILEDIKDLTSFRIYRLYWQAATYLISHSKDDLAELISLTSVKERILPGLLRLEELPREQPELAKVYPIARVLKSDWKEAIQLRLDDIPPLELNVFGKFEARVLGEPVELTLRQKQILIQLLLGYDREVIGETMWPETDPKKVSNNLSVQLNMLRKVIEPWGVPTYLFESGLKDIRADLWQLQEALKQEDVETIITLFQIPFAPGVDLPKVTEAKDNLIQDVVDLLYMSSREISQEQALIYLERVLQLDPLYEEALQKLLGILVQRGRRREAFKHYRAFSRQLKEEMGLEPMHETKALVS